VAAQPGTAIGRRDEAAAVRIHMERRNSTEGRMLRRKLEAATKLEIAEPGPARVTIVERCDRDCRNFDARLRRGIAQHVCEREGAGNERDPGAQRSDIKPAAAG